MAGSFAERFQEAWSAPTPERLTALLTPDVELVQPVLADTHGREQAAAAFGRLLDLVPDLHAEVLESWQRPGQAVIRFDLVGTLGGRELRWHLVDVFELEGELGRRRVSYFDPTPIVVAVLTRPRAWPAFLRSGVWRR